ncbi:MAG: thioredoxin family protein [Saprospiraceae bacterium]|nr:thioredoxin family protein [Saprospiraceae bacterium]
MNTKIKIEMFYTLTCPNCRILKRMLDEVLPEFGDKFEVKKSLANSPFGMLRTMKLGIHAVPALLINDEVIFRSVPTKKELINKLKIY